MPGPVICNSYTYAILDANKICITLQSTGVIRKAKVQQEVQCSAQTFYVPRSDKLCNIKKQRVMLFYCLYISCELKVNQQSIKNENLKPNNPLKVHSTNPALVSTQYSEESAELDTDDLDVPPLI